MWPARLYRIFPHYLINGTLFGKRIIEHKMWVLIFCASFVRRIFHSRRTERDSIINAHNTGIHVEEPCSCQLLIKIDPSGQIFEEYSNIKIS